MSARAISCSSCGAPIEWTITERGNRMPVDATPSPDGNIDLFSPAGKPTCAHYLRKDEISARVAGALARGGTPPVFYTSHFATCPFADQHRKKKVRA